MSVENLLKGLEDVDGDTFSYEDLDYLGFGESNIVSKVGDTEGGGEYTEVIRFFPQLETYIRLTGRYYSYNGTNWNDDYKVVEPKQKTVTVYE